MHYNESQCLHYITLHCIYIEGRKKIEVSIIRGVACHVRIGQNLLEFQTVPERWMDECKSDLPRVDVDQSADSEFWTRERLGWLLAHRRFRCILSLFSIVLAGKCKLM